MNTSSYIKVNYKDSIMLSINPIINNQYINNKNKASKKAPKLSYASHISFKSVPVKTKKQVLVDLRIAIKNAMSGIYEKVYNNGEKIEIELKNGKKIGQKIFYNFEDGSSVQIFKNRKLKKVMTEYKFNETNSTTFFSNNNMVRFIQKDKKGHIIYDERYKYGKDNFLIYSTARDNIAKTTNLVNYNDLGQATNVQVNFDKGVSHTYKYINTNLHEKVISAPNGASITMTYYYNSEIPKTIIGQYNNYRKIEYYSSQGQLKSSLIDYEGQTLKVHEVAQDGEPLKGVIIDNAGGACGVEFKNEGKDKYLYDLQSGQLLNPTKEISKWFNDIEMHRYEIEKLVDNRHMVFEDPLPIVFKKFNLNIPKENSEKNENILKNMIPSNLLLPMDSALKKLRSN